VKKSTLMQKLAGGRRPFSESVGYWGLPKERLFPLDTPEHVKTAAARFDTGADDMTPSQRLVCARRICKQARDMNVSVIGSRAFKYAGAELSPLFPQYLSLRKEATAHMADAELDKLLAVARAFDVQPNIDARVQGLDKVAAALEGFDFRHDLDGHWGAWIPDPAYSVYGLTHDPDERLEYVVKVADYEVRAGDFEGADWSLLDGKLEPEVVAGLRGADDQLSVFASLPDPHKAIIYQTLIG
jgi:hypothetical protein